MGGRDHSCEVCGRGGLNDPDGSCVCPPDPGDIRDALADLVGAAKPFEDALPRDRWAGDRRPLPDSSGPISYLLGSEMDALDTALSHARQLLEGSSE